MKKLFFLIYLYLFVNSANAAILSIPNVRFVGVALKSDIARMAYDSSQPVGSTATFDLEKAVPNPNIQGGTSTSFAALDGVLVFSNRPINDDMEEISSIKMKPFGNENLGEFDLTQFLTIWERGSGSRIPSNQQGHSWLFVIDGNLGLSLGARESFEDYFDALEDEGVTSLQLVIETVSRKTISFNFSSIAKTKNFFYPKPSAAQGAGKINACMSYLASRLTPRYTIKLNGY